MERFRGLAAISHEFKRAILAAFGVAAAIPLVLGALSLIFFLLVFYLETILIGAYPFLGTVRVGTSALAYSIVFPLNWGLTVLQWTAVAWLLAFRARVKGTTDLGDQIFLACAVWFATNFTVRLLFLLLGLGFITTQVRM